MTVIRPDSPLLNRILTRVPLVLRMGWRREAGRHVLTLSRGSRYPTALIMDKMLVTNDHSHVPPGKRFMW